MEEERKAASQAKSVREESSESEDESSDNNQDENDSDASSFTSSKKVDDDGDEKISNVEKNTASAIGANEQHPEEDEEELVDPFDPLADAPFNILDQVCCSENSSFLMENTLKYY